MARCLIVEMSVANPLWGRYGFMANCSNSGSMSARPRSQRIWPREDGHRHKVGSTFLRNHADGIGSIDMFVVPTISFRPSTDFWSCLLWLGVTTHPTAECIARQLTEACGWSERPPYIIRDRDSAYRDAFIRRITAMGIRDRPISTRVPGLCRSLRRAASSSLVQPLSKYYNGGGPYFALKNMC
jgi:hypothetical protein